MNVLVTAGNTQALLDQVRCITNIFTGKTGARLAIEAYRQGGNVTLLTSRPEVLAELNFTSPDPARWSVRPYRTFDELHELMREEITSGYHDAVLHSAAVSDYLAVGTYVPEAGATFDPSSGRWNCPGSIHFRNVYRGKVKSSHSELWLRLLPALKLVDQIRGPWGFRGILVKFKLEVGVGEEELCGIAEASRKHSNADLMVANTLAGMHDWALVGAGEYQKVLRAELAAVVLNNVAALAEHESDAPGSSRNQQ